MAISTKFLLVALMLMVCAVLTQPIDKKIEVKPKKLGVGITKKKSDITEPVTESNIVIKDAADIKIITESRDKLRDKMGIQSSTDTILSSLKKNLPKKNTTTKPMTEKKDKIIMGKVQKSAKMKIVPLVTEIPSSTSVTSTNAETDTTTVTSIPIKETTSESMTVTTMKYFQQVSKTSTKQSFGGQGGFKSGQGSDSLSKPKKDGLLSLITMGGKSNKKEEGSQDLLGLSSLFGMGGSKMVPSLDTKNWPSFPFLGGKKSELPPFPKPDFNSFSSMGGSKPDFTSFLGGSKPDFSSFLSMGDSKSGSNPVSGLSSLFGMKSSAQETIAPDSSEN